MTLPSGIFRLTALLVVLLTGLPAGAAEPDDEGLPALSAEARAVLDAAERRDRERLRSVVERNKPPAAWDPWCLAHELVLHGHRRAARLLASVSSRPGAASLAAYVRNLERRPPSIAPWVKRMQLAALARRGDPYGIRKAVTPAEIDVDPGTVTAVLLREQLAAAYDELEKPDDALRLRREAAERALRLGWLGGATRNLEAAQALGVRLHDSGALVSVFEMLIQVGTRSGNARQLALALTNLASTTAELGNYRGALASYRQVLEQHTEALHPSEHAGILNLMATAELRLGHVANANRAALRAEDLARWAHRRSIELEAPRTEQEEYLAALADAFETRGRIAAMISDHVTARRHYDAAAALLAKLEAPRYHAYRMQVLANLGALEISRGRLDEAERITKETMAFWQEIGEASFVGRSRGNLAEIARRRAESLQGEARRAQLQRAEKLLRRAIVELRKAEDLGGLCTLLIESGRVHRLLGEYGPALSHLEDAFALASELASVDLETQALTERAETHRARADHAAALASAKEAARGTSYLFDRLTPRQSALARRQTARIYELGLEAAAKLGGRGRYLDEAFDFLERGRAVALLSRLEARGDLVRMQISKSLREQEVAARAREAKAYAALLTARRRGRMQPLREAREALEAARTAYSEVVARIQLQEGWQANLIYPSFTTRKALEASLDPREVLLLYGQAGGRVYVLRASRAGSRLLDLGEAGPILAACHQLEAGLTRVDQPVDAAALQRLLRAPLGLGADVERVLLSTAGCLSYVPPALLFPGREVCCVASGTAWKLAKERKLVGARDVLAVGDPAYENTVPPESWNGTRAVHDGVLTRLEGSGREAEAVGTVKLLRERASETRLREMLAGRQRDAKTAAAWRAVHLACHGVVDRARPSASGLALAHSAQDDGLLRCDDIARLRLEADLVILSACDSGRGEEARGEGIHGFTSMFQIAGARRVIVSLWPVDDEATRTLMIEFHRRWNAKDPKDREGAARALRAAQAHVRTYAAKHGPRYAKWAHPHYWAAWQLWGPGD